MLQRITKGTFGIACIALAIIFTSLAFPSYERTHWYRQIVFTITSPPQKLVTNTSDLFKNIWRHYIDITKKAKENDLLKIKLAETEKKIVEVQEIKKENERLHEMFSLTESLKIKGIGARVISSNVLAEFKTATIDKGSRDGLKKNMTVIGPGGLVGRIGQVANSESVVLLISDPNSSVDVFIHTSGTRALLVGTSGSSALRPFYSLSRLEYLKKTSGINVEDVILTSGLDRLFPAGIPVGTVSKVENASGIFKNADVVPFVDLSQLREVTILFK